MEADSKKRGKWSSEGSAVVVAAGIGLVSAVLSAALPIWLSRTNNTNITPTDDVSGTENPAAMPNITHGVWTIVNSIDDAGTDWTSSTLKFTSQVATPTGAQLEGFFEWRNRGTIIGREFVIANLDATTRQLFIEGQYTEAVERPIATGSYSAALSEDGRTLKDGTWGNTPGRLAGIPGRWAARR